MARAPDWRDVSGRFRFAAIQSEYGRALAEALDIYPADPDTNAVVFDGRAFFRSDAALVVLSTLPGWAWVGVLKVLPKALRDGVYALIARKRYRIFGRHDVCDLDRPELEGKVL